MKRFISLFLVICLLMSTAALAFGAYGAQMHTVKIQGKYHQPQVRTLLSKVNAFRTGSNAWAWNSTNTKKIYYNRSALAYDYELEQIAMQRAAEIAVYYGAYMEENNTQNHIRPNGKKWNTAHTQYNENTGYAIGENLFVSDKSKIAESVNAAFDAWLEEDKLFDFQSHRQNILDTDDNGFISTAFACFDVDGVYYFVQLFRSTRVIKSSETVVSESLVSKSVELSDQFIDSFTLKDTQTHFVFKIGDTKTLHPVGEMISIDPFVTYYDETAGKYVLAPTILDTSPTFTSSNPAAVSVSGNKITAVGAGEATITASIYDAKLTYTVQVEPTDIAYATVTLDRYSDTYIYTGEPIHPQVTVSLGDVTLKPADYIVRYEENTEPGNAKLLIHGQGDYTGVVIKAFFIIRKEDCQHHYEYIPNTPATCLKRATTGGTQCAICDDIKVEPIEFGEFAPHTEVTIPATQSTCTVKGHSARVICSVCGDILDEGYDLPLKEHTPVADKAVAVTCLKDGRTAGTYCSVCGTTLSGRETIKAKGTHTWSAQKLQKATLKANGKIYCTCTVAGCTGSKTVKTIYYPKTFKLSKSAFTYNGKAQWAKFSVKDASGATISTANFTYSIPKGKNVGRYKITVKFKGNYSGTKYLYYDILPKNISKFVLSSVKKGFKVKWNTQKVQTNGYQIQYSLYSDFRSSKTYTLNNNKYNAATISKLTGGKKYYVRMCTYRTVKYEGKNIKLFSSWSGKKSITTKK
ncbi:MAG: CAP domain-containing protein [Clostridia bacterium]|nr:CAP domain-containing protein [Clostridia bacterium]